MQRSGRLSDLRSCLYIRTIANVAHNRHQYRRTRIRHARHVLLHSIRLHAGHFSPISILDPTGCLLLLGCLLGGLRCVQKMRRADVSILPVLHYPDFTCGCCLCNTTILYQSISQMRPQDSPSRGNSGAIIRRPPNTIGE